MAQATYVLEVDWDNSDTFDGGLEDITAYARVIRYTRGRDYASQLTGRAIAGALSATLLNTDGRFNPFLTSGPLYGSLLPGRKVRLRSTAPVAATLWAGFLDTIRPKPRAGGAHEAELTAIGPLGRLAEREVRVEPQTGITTGAAIGAILDAADWPAADRTLDTGQSTLGRWWADGPALAALREVADTESGYLGESADGKIVFEDRHHRLGGTAITSQATFSDGEAAMAPMPRTDLVFYFALEEVSGDRTDAVAGIVLTDSNTVTSNPGKLGTAAQFVRTQNEHLRGADAPALSHGDIDFTYQAWVYVDAASGSQQTIVSKHKIALASANDFEIWFYIDFLRRVVLLVGNGTTNTALTATTFGSLTLSTWYHVLAWHDAALNTLNIQINNTAVQSAACTHGSFDSDGFLRIGGTSNAGHAYDGRIDAVARWDRVLTAAERTALYGGGAGLEEPLAYGYQDAVEDDPVASIFNIFETEVRVFAVGAAQVLWTHPETGASSPLVQPGNSLEVWARYPTPAAATDAVAVDAWTTPVATTDYLGNEAPDGSGADRTADLTVTMDAFSTAAKITVTNTTDVLAGGVPIYLTLLQARGTPVTVADPVRVVTEDAASQARYGKRTYPNPAPWLSSSGEAASWGGFQRAIYASPLPILTLHMPASKSDAYLTQALTRDVSERVTVIGTGASLLGVSEDFFIEAMHHEIVSGWEHHTVYELSPATGYAGFWVLGTSQLSITTKVGY